MPFDKNVFINCPFDSEYKVILKPIIFTLTYLKFTPQISETIDSGEARIMGIQNLIDNSRYSIHDLSRMQASKKNELARFNMPFELGLDFGCKRFKSHPHSEKCFLILDAEKYRYQKSISDISGNDIAYHSNEPEKAVRVVRNWIRKITATHLDGANKIWRLYNEFVGDFYQIAKEDELSKLDIEDMPWEEYLYYIHQWLEGRQGIGSR